MTRRTPDPGRTRSCLLTGCGNVRAYDGLCIRHLWEAEHHTRYLGGPHTERVAACPACATRPPASDPTGYDRVRASLARLARLDDGWCDGDGAAMREDVLNTTSRLLDDLESATVATAANRIAALAPPGVCLETDGCATLTWHRIGCGLLSATIGDPDLPTILTLIAPGTDAPDRAHDPWDATATTLLPALERFASQEMPS